MAWTCERRHRGQEAVRIVVAHLLDPAPDLWRGLLEDPDYRVRRLLHDTDAELAREARQDIHLWWTFAAASARQPAGEQRQALVSLLQKAVDAIDARSTHRIHFVLAHAEDATSAPEARTITR
jgi:hypothetical protein